ncbi:MAG: site-specific DNA-methyltransferase [Xanthomonas perforans]|uniref:Methyltransferase n=1 Tax=Xanthomonas perforans TaxID=442694 RepID=A0A6P0FPK2_XANPE|nr:site-specific DNA-methyltransferase [Xanthomonas perforans]NEL40424.1 site-specific DNA-methyltransferase [Xanthomonas perforans]NEL78841.1 site-specific DNA-methyltransferase [Xanthomonas perforans]NEM46315.1 site-specific DNA-methyltransferase [Xanthomonas perforans]
MLQLHHGDCLDIMTKLPSRSVDLILCDLPYGTTACAWDSVIPMNALWAHYKRVLRGNGAVVLTGSQPFTSTLITSNLEWFKYCWVWVKNRPTNFAHAKNKPMKKHEDICVFSPGTTVHASQSQSRMSYNPQGVQDISPKRVMKKTSEKTDAFFADRPGHREFERKQTGFPHTILEFPTDQLGLHPTAKPVALMEYLIRTYTERGGVVMDNCMGSGTTGVAAVNTDRSFIGIERDKKYFQVSANRINAALDERLLSS